MSTAERKRRPAPMPSPTPTAHRPRWTSFVRGKLKKRGKMNKTEREYSQWLEGRKILGAVEWWAYEPITFKLTEPTASRPGIRYTPDFAVLFTDGRFELHELKGFPNPEAINRLKMAAAGVPFRFVLISKRTKKNGGGYIREEF